MKSLTVGKGQAGTAEGSFPGTVQIEVTGVPHGFSFRESNPQAHIL
jgi:hypothetical protein